MEKGAVNLSIPWIRKRGGQMKLINKLTLGHLIVGIFVIVVALAGMTAINNIDRAFNEVSEQTLPVIETLEDVRAAGLKMGGSASEFALIRAETKSNVTTVEDAEKEQVISAIKQYDSAILRYEEMVNKFFPEEKYLLENVKTSGRKLQNASTEIIALKEQGASGKIVLEKWEEFEAAKQEFQKAVNDAIAYEHKEMASRKLGTENAIAASLKTILFGGLLTLAAAIILGVYISRTISDPIIKLKDAAVEIGKGKLDTRVNIKSGDEVGILAACFNQMAQNLQQGGRELQESEERYRNLVEFSPFGIAIHSEGKIVYVNSAAAKILGAASQNELIGKPVLDIIHPDYHEIAKERIKMEEEGNVAPLLEEKFLRVDGSPVDIEIVAIPFTFHGKPACYGVFQEITQRKRMLDALQESEERFRSVVESANEAIIINDARGNIIFWNKHAQDIFGYSSDEITGKPISMIMSGKYREAFEKIPDKIKTNYIGKKFEWIGLRKDGSEFPQEVSLFSWNTDKGAFATAIVNDITERKRIEWELEEHREHLEEVVNERTKALRESEGKFHTLYDSSSDAIMMLDEKGFFDCNNATLRMFGFSKKEDFTKVHPADISPSYQPDGRDSLTAANKKIAEAFSKGTNFFEWMHRRQNGEDFPADVLLTRFQLGEKQVLQATVRDLTERKRLEDSLRLAKDEAERASRVKTDFLMTMSHELRTPLNAILGFSELLKGKAVGELNQKQERFIDNIRTGGNRLLNIISQILEIVRIENGTSELHIEKIPVPEIVDAAISDIKEKASKNNVVVEKNLDPKLEYIEADRQKLMQVFINLLENAVKFSKHEGGIVSIGARRYGRILYI